MPIRAPNIRYEGAEERKSPKTTNEVMRKRVAISQDEYESIFYAFYKVLLETTYADETNSVLDGTTHIFFSGDRFGEVRSYCAKENEVSKLLNIYKNLYTYIDSNGKEKGKLSEAMSFSNQITSRPLEN